MGDMADYYLSLDEGHWGHNVDPYKTPTMPICKLCGAICTGWRQHESGRWWLTNRGGEWHTCKNESTKL